jgi:hypothetical protein
MALSELSTIRVERMYASRQFNDVDRDRLDGPMTTPTVIELPRRREPVSADTFLGDLALGEQQLYGDTQTALIALGLQTQPPSCQLEGCGSAVVLEAGCF